jgi:hypothetical protein
MNKIQFYKVDGKPTAKLGRKVFTGYLIGELPNKFGFIYNPDTDKEGMSEWFNYKGYTYAR